MSNETAAQALGAAAPGITSQVCSRLLDAARAGLPEEVRNEAVRGLVNVAGTAVGGSRTSTVEAVLTAACRLGHEGRVPVPGCHGHYSPSWAVTATGTAAHVDDFDDTHLPTVIHPGGVTFAALWPLMVDGLLDADRLLAAFAVGVECQLRVGLAMTPWHYDEGWHITGTCGVLGAAFAVGSALDLTPDQMEHALGIAASRTVGVREGFGTSTKAWHIGKAAANGWFAAQLARRGFTGSASVLEAPRGYLQVLSPHGSAPERVTDRLGDRWEMLDVTYKPYPCGIVSHPAIEAAEALADGIRDQDVTLIELECNPLVVELTGNAHPTDGLQARFSTAHGVVAGLLSGSVGLTAYDDPFVRRRDVAELRARVALRPSATVARDSARLTVTMSDGTDLHADVDQARGSSQRPLSDAHLDRKTAALVDLVLPGSGAIVCNAVRGLATGATSPQDVVNAVLPRPSTDRGRA